MDHRAEPSARHLRGRDDPVVPPAGPNGDRRVDAASDTRRETPPKRVRGEPAEDGDGGHRDRGREVGRQSDLKLRLAGGGGVDGP